MPILRSRLLAARRLLRRPPVIVVPPADPGDPPAVTYATTKKWSEITPAPTNGSTVAIPADTHIILDVATPSLLLLSISGKLSADPAAASLAVTAEHIEVMDSGVWEIGTASARWTKPYVITLTGAKPADTAANLVNSTVRSIHNMGGWLRWFGDVSRVHRARLGADAAAGATALTLSESASNWKSGDEIAVGPTEYYGIGGKRTQRMTLASNASGASITTTAGLEAAKFGRLQYVTDAGLSFTAGTLTPKAEWGSDPTLFPPSVLDERAMVINLTRNIIVQGANDSAWTTDGWGGDLMNMGQAGQMAHRVKISGVLFRRCGKRGVLGKYPIHWHMISYESYNAADPTNSGKTYYGVVEGNYITDSAFVDSANRAVVVHGTNGIDVARNVACTIGGHAYFLENGSEMYNKLRDNVALNVTDPHPGVAETSLQFTASGTRTTGTRLARHEFGTFVTGYWITNPKNDFTGNWAADCGIGIWFSFAQKTFGPSRNVLVPGTTSPMRPYLINHGVIDNNYSQGNARYGAATELAVVDETGAVDTPPNGYSPRPSDVGGPSTPYILTRLNLFKNGSGTGTTTGAYLNRVFPALYSGFVVFDNMQLSIHGSAEGTIERSTIGGRTLNTPSARTEAPFVGIATYHFGVGHQKCLFVNLPFSADSAYKGDRDLGGGTVSMGDLYLSAVEIGHVICGGNKYVNAHAGYRCKPPWMKGLSSNTTELTFSGAMWDPHGAWGRAGSYMVYGNYAPQNAFFTHGLTDAVATEPAATSGTVDTFTRFFGIQSFRTEQNPANYLPYMPLQVYRLDNATDQNIVGQWFVKGKTGNLLPQMRHFAAADGGIYRWTYPYTDGTPTAPSQFHTFAILSNGMSGSSRVVLGVPWQAATVRIYQRAYFDDAPRAADGITPTLNSYMLTTAVSNGQARLANVMVSTLAEVVDPVGNADCTKVFLDTTNKVAYFVFKDNLAYAGPVTSTYPLGIKPDPYLVQFRKATYVTVLPS